MLLLLQYAIIRVHYAPADTCIIVSVTVLNLRTSSGLDMHIDTLILTPSRIQTICNLNKITRLLGNRLRGMLLGPLSSHAVGMGNKPEKGVGDNNQPHHRCRAV